MRRLLATTVLVATLPGIAAAQDRPSLLDYISPDVIMQRLLQSGVMLLRTQLDMKYSDMSVDLRTGGITITDVVAWPLPEWDTEGTCEVAIDRVTLRSGALDEYDRLRLKAQMSGVSFPASCLPDEPRGAMAMAGLNAIDMPRLTMDIDYGLPASDATVRLYADINDVAAADITAHFAYFWLDGRKDMEEPEPVAFLQSATLTLENRGIWEALKDQLPPPFTGEGAGMMIEGMVGEGLIDENPEDAGLTDSQRAFVKSLGETWPAFLANPDTLVLETNIDGDTFLDFGAMEDDLRVVFDTLQPKLALVPNRATQMISLDLLSSAMSGDTGAMVDEQLREIGEALITGFRAPRNIGKGLEILGSLAEAGDAGAALLLSDAMEARDPSEAYRWALRAGAGGEAGATARLDRLERVLGFAEVIELQLADSGGGLSADAGALGSIASIRDQAAMRASGRGLARSYPAAAMWAMIGSAAGDPESADILEGIDERVRLSGAEATKVWATHEAAANEVAMKAWLDQDLPARLTGGSGGGAATPNKNNKKSN